MSFYNHLIQYKWDEIKSTIDKVSIDDVKNVLAKDNFSLNDLPVLISKSAEKFLKDMADIAFHKTQKRFGKNIQIYAPIYLSNLCSNNCLYCGFSASNKFKRIVLTEEQLEIEYKAVKKMGIDHALLVTGEAEKKVGISYLLNATKLAKKYFTSVSLEVQPLEEWEYRELANEGINSVYVYQETYNKANYPLYHLKGKKADYRYRLETPDRLGSVEMHKIGLGALLGLEDFRVESFFLALHLTYLKKKYWKTKYSLSLPRLRPHNGAFQPNYKITDKNIVQMILAFRLFDEDLEISLSTRESPALRDNLIGLGITSMSAASKTNPGGYAVYPDSSEQFSIYDNRSVRAVALAIVNKGFNPVFKDWEDYFTGL